MKQLLTIILLLAGVYTLQAQEQKEDFSDAKYSYHYDVNLEHTLSKEGNKVYIEANNRKTAKYVKSILRKWGYWQITKNKSEANFDMTIVNKGGFDVFMCYAVLIDPSTGKVFYRTPLVNTLMRVTMHGKKAAVKKLVRKMRHHFLNENDDEA